MQVADARREKQKALIGLVGPSGSGKSLSALLLAYGIVKEAHPDLPEEELWKKIGAADTEHKRLLNYVGQTHGNITIGAFKYINFEPPFNTDRYNMAINLLMQQGVEVIIVDSLSHQWQGEGGVVETHGGMQGNSFQNWGKLAPESSKLVKGLTTAAVHMITTLRVKSDYVIELVDGKNVPKKVGMKPVQKDDMEYEFDTVFSIGMDHMARVSKDITNLFEGDEFIITPEIGSKLYRYLELGIDVQAEERARREEEEANRLSNVAKIRELSSTDESVAKIVSDCEFKANLQLEKMTVAMVDKIISLIGGKLNVQN
ncbi:energy-coupling factor transporter ATP-binding protein EcfA2 [Lysinibacillus parviboronicapiens]|uniref:Energy-coupling factor transporter ATP-binding protein EcfA2 n=1 Tax=Lysinibacillus parviboronicapiens TaxID=436516 RepID=A0ABV2PIP8_9BACI